MDSIRPASMLPTKLILIEGLPGAGKSSTAAYLHDTLQRNGVDCRVYLEDDKPHPIDCLDFRLRGLAREVVPLWARLVETLKGSAAIAIIESRLWQNTAMFLYMGGYSVRTVRDFSREVWRAVAPVSPVLIYLDEENTQAALQRLYAQRGAAWVDAAIADTKSYAWFQSRGLDDFAGWVKFFEEWRTVEQGLFAEWPGAKLHIGNAHEDWSRCYREICEFIGIVDLA